MDNFTVRFLWNATEVLKNSKNSERFDYIINQLRLKSLDFSTCVPNEINPSEMCIYCGNLWRDGLFSLHLKCHKNNKIKKKIRKIRKDNITMSSPCRKNYMTYYKSQKDNVLVKKCLVCKRITKYCMNKPLTDIKKESVSLQCVVEQNFRNKKRKRKSGKKQSFAGLSPLAVLQARLSSTKEYNASIPLNDFTELCEPSDIKNLSNITEINLLLPNKAKTTDETISSTTVSQSPSSNSISRGFLQDKVKKQKLENGALTTITKKSKKKKKKSFLSELRTLL